MQQLFIKNIQSQRVQPKHIPSKVGKQLATLLFVFSLMHNANGPYCLGGYMTMKRLGKGQSILAEGILF